MSKKSKKTNKSNSNKSNSNKSSSNKSDLNISNSNKNNLDKKNSNKTNSNNSLNQNNSVKNNSKNVSNNRTESNKNAVNAKTGDSSKLSEKVSAKTRKNWKLWQKILAGIGIVIGAILLIVICFFGWLTAVEYRPDDVEKVEIDTAAGEGKKLTEGSSLSLMTWNIGYGALGDNADFFMDGGESVMTAIPERVDVNLVAIGSSLAMNNPDVIFLQEVDLNSKRSYNKDELTYLKGKIVELSNHDWEADMSYLKNDSEDNNSEDNNS